MRILKAIRTGFILVHCVLVIVILFFIMIPQAIYLWDFEKFMDTVDRMVNQLLKPIKYNKN